MYTRSAQSAKRPRFYTFGVLVVIVGLIVVNVLPAQAAGNDSLYLSPASGTYKVGETLSVAIRENSYTDQVNSVEADLSYTAAKLQLVGSPSISNSAFKLQVVNSGGGGSISLTLGVQPANGSATSVSGDQLVANVTFKVLASGVTDVVFNSSSAVLSATTNTNVASTMTGGSYTLQAQTVPTSKGSTTGIKTTSPPKTTASSTTSTMSVTPEGNPHPVMVPDKSTVELSGQASVQTAPSDAGNVTKIEYYLNNKLVATVTHAPYAYSVDTKKLRNGSYTLATKTYYKNGQTTVKDTALIVKNPFGWTQFKLQVEHYALYGIIFILLVLAAVWWWTRNHPNRWLDSHNVPTTPAAGTPPQAHVGIM